MSLGELMLKAYKIFIKTSALIFWMMFSFKAFAVSDQEVLQLLVSMAAQQPSAQIEEFDITDIIPIQTSTTADLSEEYDRGVDCSLTSTRPEGYVNIEKLLSKMNVKAADRNNKFYIEGDTQNGNMVMKISGFYGLCFKGNVSTRLEKKEINGNQVLVTSVMTNTKDQVTDSNSFMRCVEKNIAKNFNDPAEGSRFLNLLSELKSVPDMASAQTILSDQNNQAILGKLSPIVKKLYKKSHLVFKMPDYDKSRSLQYFMEGYISDEIRGLKNKFVDPNNACRFFYGTSNNLIHSAQDASLHSLRLQCASRDPLDVVKILEPYKADLLNLTMDELVKIFTNTANNRFEELVNKAKEEKMEFKDFKKLIDEFDKIIDETRGIEYFKDSGNKKELMEFLAQAKQYRVKLMEAYFEKSDIESELNKHKAELADLLKELAEKRKIAESSGIKEEDKADAFTDVEEIQAQIKSVYQEKLRHLVDFINEEYMEDAKNVVETISDKDPKKRKEKPINENDLLTSIGKRMEAFNSGQLFKTDFIKKIARVAGLNSQSDDLGKVYLNAREVKDFTDKAKNRSRSFATTRRKIDRNVKKYADQTLRDRKIYDSYNTDSLDYLSEREKYKQLQWQNQTMNQLYQQNTLTPAYQKLQQSCSRGMTNSCISAQQQFNNAQMMMQQFNLQSSNQLSQQGSFLNQLGQGRNSYLQNRQLQWQRNLDGLWNFSSDQNGYDPLLGLQMTNNNMYNFNNQFRLPAMNSNYSDSMYDPRRYSYTYGSQPYSYQQQQFNFQQQNPYSLGF